MANYVKATNFATKDSLASGNPSKLVKGTEIDVEFNAIASAITSKADADSPTLTGTPLAPTASSVTNNTQIATTAFVQAIAAATKAALYPVGSIYVNATNATNPGTLLGFGTWVAFGAGRVPVGFNASDPLFDSAEETGGSKDAIVVSHTHTITDTGHTHTVPSATSNAGTGSVAGSVPSGTIETSSSTTGISINSTGSSGTNANLQPYITVYMWKRTA
jgi:hypothetical protein